MTAIKPLEYKVNINGGYESVEAPVSLYEVFGEAMCASYPEGVSLFSTLRVDQGAIRSRFLYLRITDAPSLSEVRIGGKVIYEVSEDLYFHIIDVKPYIGAAVNEIELVFAKGGKVSGSGVGLFGSAELVRTNTAVISGITVTECLCDGGVRLDLRLSAVGSVDGVRTVATLVSGSGQMYYGGLSGLCGSINVKDPLYWWPKGLGIQNLYRLTVNLYGEMEIEDTLEVKVGLRVYSSSRSANEALVEVNGDAFLPMGAVYVPERRRGNTSSAMREAAFLAAAARSGFNTLVIDKDAPMPTEQFFSLSDAYGIAVIVEADLEKEDYLSRVERLSGVYYHPSLAMLELIGGGEVERTRVKEKLRFIAPDLSVVALDERNKYPSYPSLPCEKSLNAWLLAGERNLFSDKVESSGADKVRQMILSSSESYLYAESLSDFAYVSGVNAANRIKDYVANTRAVRGTLGRAIYRSLGDSEFCVSDSSLDAYARWKPLQYVSARAFAPVLMRAESKGEGYVVFFVSNERRLGFVGTLEYRIVDNLNNVIYSETAPVDVERGTARLMFARDLGKYIKGHEREYYLEYVLRDPTGIHTRDVLLFTEPKRFKFSDPDIKVEITGADRRFSVTLTAKAFASMVEISFPETEVVLQDNYFDITSGAPIKISLSVTGGIETAQHLSRTVRIRSLYDLIR